MKKLITIICLLFALTGNYLSAQSTPVKPLVAVSPAAPPVLTYQWQVRDYYVWHKVADSDLYQGTTTGTLQVTKPTAKMDGTKFRCVITTPEGKTTSAIVVLNVTPYTPKITQQPDSVAVVSGQSAVFKVASVVTATPPQASVQ